jgi:hypothetical protein
MASPAEIGRPPEVFVESGCDGGAFPAEKVSARLAIAVLIGDLGLELPLGIACEQFRG